MKRLVTKDMSALIDSLPAWRVRLMATRTTNPETTDQVIQGLILAISAATKPDFARNFIEQFLP